MDFNSFDSLKENGFEGSQSIENLFISCREVPEEAGVYMVLWNSKARPEFICPGTGGFFKGKDPNLPVPELESKWVDETKVLYIGQTGSSLRRRISQYMRFGQGKAVGHYGGRCIWQVEGCRELLVCWLPLGRSEARPKDVEGWLLEDFLSSYGRLPFANLRS